MSIMFANSRSSQGSNGFLVEFKAGRSILQAGSSTGKRKVVADKARGLIFIKQSSDQLMHFCWKNRETGAVVDDLIIFPGDTEFVHVKECSDGRVYMLKFKSTDERRLFWMQEGKLDKDEENCKKVNETLNNPPAPRAAARGSTERVGSSSFGGLAALSGGADSELGALGNLDQSQLMRLLSMMNHSGGSSGTDVASAGPNIPVTSSQAAAAENAGTASAHLATPSNTPSNGTVAESAPNTVKLSELKDIIANINVEGTVNRRTAIELADVLCGDKAIESVRRNGDQLKPHIPNQEPIYNADQELEQTVRTPQFRQAVNIFGHILQMGQLAPVLNQFGISGEVAKAAQTGDVIAFARKLTEAEAGVHEAEPSVSQPEPHNPEINAQISKDADEEEKNESLIRTSEGQADKKPNKPADDNMDLD